MVLRQNAPRDPSAIPIEIEYVLPPMVLCSQARKRPVAKGPDFRLLLSE